MKTINVNYSEILHITEPLNRELTMQKSPEPLYNRDIAKPVWIHIKWLIIHR